MAKFLALKILFRQLRARSSNRSGGTPKGIRVALGILIGVLSGAIYIWAIVWPPITEWVTKNPDSDWYSSVMWYYYLAAGVTGGIVGAISAILANLLGNLFLRWKNSLILECIGHALGSAVVIALFCFWIFQSDFEASTALLYLCAWFIGNLVSCILTIARQN